MYENIKAGSVFQYDTSDNQKGFVTVIDLTATVYNDGTSTVNITFRDCDAYGVWDRTVTWNLTQFAEGMFQMGAYRFLPESH